MTSPRRTDPTDADFRILPVSPDRLAATVEEWRTAKRVAARFIAIGMTQEDTAERVGVTDRTVRAWCADADFDAYVERLRQVMIGRLEPSIAGNVALAMDIQRQVLTGEMKASDPRYREATKLLDRFLDRMLYVEPAPGPAGDSAPGVSVAIHNSAPQRN